MHCAQAEAPGPLAGALRAGADARTMREGLLDLVAGGRCESSAGAALEVAYSVVLGRRQAAAALVPEARTDGEMPSQPTRGTTRALSPRTSW